MRYPELLKVSWMRYWQNKSLLSVLLLEFIARTIAIAAFIAIDIAVVVALNGPVIPGEAGLTQFMNAKTYIVLTILLLVEFFAILYINSFFSAGFFGMLRNVVQDGSTTFDEFLPNAKRYWYATFRYLIIPYILLLLAMLPFAYFYALSATAAAFGGMFDASLLPYLAVSGVITLLVAAAILYWFSYGSAIIVFDDTDAWTAMKDSFALAKRRAGATMMMTALCMLVLLLAFAIYHSINLTFMLLAQRLQQEWMLTAARILELLLQIITLSAAVIAGIIVFMVYDGITSEKAARHVRAEKMPVSRIRKRA